jgi:hypothetical protein
MALYLSVPDLASQRGAAKKRTKSEFKTKKRPEYQLFRIWGRIKLGAMIGQDHGFYRWPDCSPPLKEYEGEEYCHTTKYPSMLFVLVFSKEHDSVTCYADGYGAAHWNKILNMGSYGNGAIHTKATNVEVVYREHIDTNLPQLLRN